MKGEGSDHCFLVGVDVGKGGVCVVDTTDFATGPNGPPTLPHDGVSVSGWRSLAWECERVARQVEASKSLIANRPDRGQEATSRPSV